MKNVIPGIYERIVSEGLQRDLAELPRERIEVTGIDQAEAAGTLTKYLSHIIKRVLTATAEHNDDGLAAQIQLVNDILNFLEQRTNEVGLDDETIYKEAQTLLSIAPETAYIGKKKIVHMVRPETSLVETSLFTGAKTEPSLASELKREICSSDRIDMLVSFVKWSGLRLIFEDLQQFTQRGGQLRLIATSYMGATDVKAIDELAKLPNTSIRISYDTKRTRLHAKAYIFYRDTGYDTAYIGSSNLSQAALSTGLEWNTKLTSHDAPAMMDKIAATFDTYWNTPEFEPYESDNENDKRKLTFALQQEKGSMVADNSAIYLFTIRPYFYQKQILEEIASERIIRHNSRNLLAIATGCGKTMIAAFDYKRFCEEHPHEPHRLLFIAHREEILSQSRACFQVVLRDANFGGLWVGNNMPENERQLAHLFMSIQTFNAKEWQCHTRPDSYDYIVIDEAHHAAAASYQPLLNYYEPKILLGLTATPERMDSQDITKYFGGHITAELRLPDAIEGGMLSPFHYFGVTDIVDLSQLHWERGRYRQSDLNNVYVLDHKKAAQRAALIMQSVQRYVTSIADMHAIGFCVSCDHADFMAEFFNTHGIPALSLSAQTADEERRQAKEKLATGEVKIIFVVDLYNEGVDIPSIDTILFLRPTDSLTIFLQQLGRGLRLADGKDCLTVLDFIGQANRHYRFAEKFTALLLPNHHRLSDEIAKGFTSLPHGCFIELEERAQSFILDNIKHQLNNKNSFLEALSGYEMAPTLQQYLDDNGLTLQRFYHRSVPFSLQRLCATAELIPEFHEPDEDVLTKSLSGFADADDSVWLEFLATVLPHIDEVNKRSLTELELRMLQMMYFTIWHDNISDNAKHTILDRLAGLKQNPHLLAELHDIVTLRLQQLRYVGHDNDLDFACPLRVHCHYTRDQLCAAFDMLKPNTLRQGVYQCKDKHSDLLFITLNKSEKDYSPSTMYHDYSLNETLFHWESQSTTSDTSATARRYFHNRELGQNILLFVREAKKDFAGSMPYVFLGNADYVRHTGSRPVSIIWKLRQPIPSHFLAVTNQLAAQ